jgi:hypothetical protein
VALRVKLQFNSIFERFDEVDGFFFVVGEFFKVVGSFHIGTRWKSDESWSSWHQYLAVSSHNTNLASPNTQAKHTIGALLEGEHSKSTATLLNSIINSL